MEGESERTSTTTSRPRRNGERPQHQHQAPTQQQPATSHSHHLLRRSIRPAAPGAGCSHEAPRTLSPPAGEAFREDPLGDTPATAAAARGEPVEQALAAAPDRSFQPRPRPRPLARSRSKGENSPPPFQSPRLDPTPRAARPLPAMADRRPMAAAPLAGAASGLLFGRREARNRVRKLRFGIGIRGDLDWIREGELGIGEFKLCTRVVT